MGNYFFLTCIFNDSLVLVCCRKMVVHLIKKFIFFFRAMDDLKVKWMIVILVHYHFLLACENVVMNTFSSSNLLEK